MQPMTRLLLILLLAPLLGDFLLQTERMLAQKARYQWRSYLRHGLTHYALSLFLVAFLTPLSPRSARLQAVLLGLVAAHLLLDRGKRAFTRAGKWTENARTFAVDQMLHLGTIGAAGLLLYPSGGNELRAAFSRIPPVADKLLVASVVYVAVILGGGYLIRFLTRPLTPGLAGAPAEVGEMLTDAGMHIGWLERFLILTAMLMQSPTTVGLIFTAKSVARFPELKDARFAEYYLIGTLMSVTAAVIGGLILDLVFYGQISLK